MTQQRLTQGARVTVRREKHARADLVYPMKVHHDDGDHIVVVGPFSGDEALDLGYAVFEPTDIFIEHFWRAHACTVGCTRRRRPLSRDAIARCS